MHTRSLIGLVVWALSSLTAACATDAGDARGGAAALPPSESPQPVPAAAAPTGQAGAAAQASYGGLAGQAAPSSTPAAGSPAAPSDPGAAPATPLEPMQPAAPAASDAEWAELIAGDWTLPGGSEEYWCVRKTVTEDVYARGFRAINPPGTHHTILSVGAPTGPDGVTPCSSAVNSSSMLFGSGVGTDDVIFPDGIAIKISAGQQVMSNLHLFNAGDAPLSGRSGNAMLLTTQSEAAEYAETVLAGPLFLSIPSGVGEVVQSGACTMPSEMQIFSLQPHLHKTGIHTKVIAETAQGDVVLHDGPFDVDAQVYHPVDPPVTVPAGSRVRVECTYLNQTGQTLRFGESSADEMCLVSLYRFPAVGNAGTVCAR